MEYATTVIRYGPAPSQYIKLTVPEKITDAETPVAVIIHGGFWKQKYTIDNSAIDTMAPYFLSRGIAACLVEYRRVGTEPLGSGDAGGWPLTNDDIVLALNKLHEACSMDQFRQFRLCTSKIFLLGHSAGGHLAMWVSMASNVSRLSFVPLLCVALAPICDLVEAAKRRLLLGYFP